MALAPQTDPLDRALAAAREETPDGWIDLSQSVMSRVRALVSPSDPVLTYAEDGSETRDEEGSRTYVSSRVVNTTLGRLLRSAPTHSPDRITLDVDDVRLVGVELALVCAYGVDLHALADQVRAEVLSELRELLGPAPDLGPDMIEIEIADVVDGDPNLL